MKRILVVLLTLLVIGCSKKEMPVIQHESPEMEYYVKRYIKQVVMEHYYLSNSYSYADSILSTDRMIQALDTIYKRVKMRSTWYHNKQTYYYTGTWVYNHPEVLIMTTEVQFQDTTHNFFRIESNSFITRIDGIILKDLNRYY